jgi:hypothetical protein
VSANRFTVDFALNQPLVGWFFVDEAKKRLYYGALPSWRQELYMNERHQARIELNEQERTELYQGWVAEALVEGIADIPELVSLRDTYALTDEDEKFLRYKDASMDTFRAVEHEFQRLIDEAMDEAVRELQETIFEPELFRVGVVVDGRGRRVEGVVRDGLRVLPVVDGEPYVGEVEQVFFDR